MPYPPRTADDGLVSRLRRAWERLVAIADEGRDAFSALRSRLLLSCLLLALVSLAAVIVGESLLPSRKLYLATLAVIVGAIVYRFFIAVALNSDFIGLQAQDLNLVTALLVTVALVVPRLRQHWSGKKGG